MGPLIVMGTTLALFCSSAGAAVNLSMLPGATAIADDSYYLNPPSYAIDNNPGTNWAANGAGSAQTPHWLIVSLPQTCAITQIEVVGTDSNMSPDYGNVYHLYTSSDQANWTLQATGEWRDSIAGFIQTHTLGQPVDAAFVRYEVVGGLHWATVFELRALGAVPEPAAAASLLMVVGGLLRRRRS